MIGLDTNVVVRYVTQDDRAQSAIATRFIRSLSPEEPGFVSLIVMVEVAWVLDVSYRLTRQEVFQVLDTLLRSKELIVERAEVAWKALRHFSIGNAGFADHLIDCCNDEAGCRHTVTFDQSAAKMARMRLLK